MDCSPPGSSVQGIFQARILEWVAMPFSRDQTPVSCISCTGRQVLYQLSHQGTRKTLRWLELPCMWRVEEMEVRLCIMIEARGRRVVGWEGFIYYNFKINISPCPSRNYMWLACPMGLSLCDSCVPLGNNLLTAYNLKSTRNLQLSLAAWLL